MSSFDHLQLSIHGAQLFGGGAKSNVTELSKILAAYDGGEAGCRIADDPALARQLCDEAGLAALPNSLANIKVRPVRVILFDKTSASNWALGWHQDRTICVSERIETPGFGPWTTKQGLLHVQPPFGIIEQMITLRIHLDPVDATNGPLLVALGSHRKGQIPEREVRHVASTCEQLACLAQAGDVWAYSTPIIHASERSKSQSRRRVLQVDYSAETLPNGLQWRGI